MHESARIDTMVRMVEKVDCPACRGTGKIPDFIGTAGAKDDMGKAFAGAGFDDLWFCGDWFAGVWTGPQRDLICVKDCDTNEEAEIWLSPPGATPEEATRLSLEKQARLAAGRRICHRCGFVGAWSEDMEWCTGCHEELYPDHETKQR